MLTIRQIQKIIRQWKTECGVTHTVLFKYNSLHGELTICTDQPGYMIGLHGKTFYKYKEIFKNLDSKFNKISFIETDGIA